MAGAPPAQEEAVKRNTDCVYFLASPLTCKKGSECEYRHSDIARVNPRDCWFWLHGNCLNPKCGFRHPPLDGLLGTQTPASIGHSLTPLQNATTPTSHVPNSSTKQSVPCVFFQKGFCLKGDWCPFLHAPNSASSKASLALGTASSAEPVNFKNASGGREKFSHEKKVPPIDIASSVKVSQKAKPSVELEPAPPRNEFSMLSTTGVNTLLDYSATNGSPFYWSDSVQQPLPSVEPRSMNNKDAEEVSREPSPGFDVLVDDEQRDSDYYPNEDQYGMPGEHEARDEYDIDSATDYNLINDIESERFRDPLGYDLHEIRKGRHALEQRRASSERMLGRGYLERRPYAIADSVNKVDELDLRHRLNKRKKANGLRSVISHEHAGDRKIEDRRYPGFNRDEHHVSLHENYLSSQLRGRIRPPDRSSSPIEKDAILGLDRGRLSPARTSSSSHHGRIRDRIKGRVREDFHNAGKSHHSLPFKRDAIGYNTADFTGPKSLTELKSQKNAQPNIQLEADQQSLGKRKQPMLDGYLQSTSDVSFEGPKPLEEILKRKRGENIGIVRKRGENIGIVRGKKSPEREGTIAYNNEKEENGVSKMSSTSSNWVSVAYNDKAVSPVSRNKDVFKFESVDNTKAEESRSVAGVYTNLQPIPRTIEAEDDVNVMDEVDKDGESDLEQEGGENYDLYDGENGEYLEDDDDDDFAKKMGVMYS